MQSDSSARDGFLAVEAIRKLVRLLRDSAHTAQGETGLTGAQLFVLRVLARHPGLSINELAERTMTHQSSVSVVVSRLVERGLVVRRPAPDDRRRQIAELSARGRLLHRSAPAVAQERIVAAMRELSAERRRGLCAGLRALTDALGVPPEEAPMFFEDDAEKEAPVARARRQSTRQPTRKRRTAHAHA
ncbi:MAG TPA: MarR family transcriptional regulator [Polyangia bacterium]|nr:MarR family transcriptional regulator [Polyangia bacterium]